MQGLTIALGFAALLAGARPAAAQPTAGDPCRDGLKQERAGGLPRAFLELTRCAAGGSDPGPEAAAALRRVKKKLAEGKYAPVSFSLVPAEAELRIAPFTDGAALREPHSLWLPYGRHTYVATAPGRTEVRGEIVVDSPARVLLQVSLEPVHRGGAPRAVDFEAEGPAVDEPIVVADPRPKKLPSLIPKRFRGGLDSERDSSERGARTAERDSSVRGARAADPATARRPARRWPWILTWGL